MMIRFAPILIAALVVGGCTSRNLTSAVVSFDSSVTKAVEVHNAQLDKVLKLHDAVLRDQLAVDKTWLVTTGECLALLDAYEPALVADCQVKRKDKFTKDQTPIDVDPVRVDRLKALARSLGGYSSSLRLLFADASADKKAFSKAVGGLATAIGGLQGEIERASGAKGVNTKALGAVATLISEAGSLYFEYERSRVLRKIIKESHPMVVAATEILDESSDNARTALLLQTVFDEMNNADNSLRDLLATGSASKSKIRKAQDRVFKAHRDFLTAASVTSAFGKIRDAHSAMVKAANEGMSTADLAALAEQLIALAGRVDEAVKILEEEL